MKTRYCYPEDNMYVELEKAILIFRLKEAKAAYVNALFDLIMDATKEKGRKI